MPKRPIVTLTVHLLKATLTSPTDALKKTVVNVVHDVVPSIGDLYTLDSFPHPPKWAEFFHGAIPSGRKLINSSTAGVLFVSAHGRLLALTFGQGKHLLEQGAWEEGFGLRVTLNSIDPSKIKSMDHKSFEAVTRHTRTQTSREGSTDDFGLDIERDLVRAVTGEPKDASLGKRLTGMDALVVTASVDLTGVPALLDRFMIQYAAKDYQQHFPWIDNIAEVRDPALKSLLDDKLAMQLQATSPDHLWLSIPDIVEWSTIGGFKYGRTDKVVQPDLHIKDFLKAIDISKITPDFLRNRKILVMDPDGDLVSAEWPVYRCLYCEVDIGGETYLLSGGKWYRIEKNFVIEVNKAVASLVGSSPALPPYLTADADEAAYCVRVATQSAGVLAHMDRHLVHHGGGHSSIEVCDLFSSSREFVHVKRYGGSSAPLSHLFWQGLVSAQAWVSDAGFRKKANVFLPKTHKLPDSSKKPDTSHFPVVFAVVSRSTKTIDKSLPFFSRLALRNTAKQLSMLGYPVSIVKIDQP